MTYEDFLALFTKPLYRMCELHRPAGVLPFGREKIYKDLKAGEFPQGVHIEGAGRCWTNEMLAQEMYRRYLAKQKQQAA